MPTFEFDASVKAQTEEEAIQKMNCLITLGGHLTLSELQVLANTVQSPTALALVKQKLGLK